MKYFSEKLNKLFDTAKELKAAEAAARNEEQKMDESCDEPVCSEDVFVKQPTKKELAAAITEAETVLENAYADYEVAKKQVEELSKDYLATIEAIITPAKNAVKAAEQARYDAIRDFNEQYGAYQTTLTGDRAAKELIRAINDINNLQRKAFNDAFWFFG